MCGIGCVLEDSSTAAKQAAEELVACIRPRGPDHSACVVREDGALALCAAVLHMRGERMALQPAEDAAGNFLLWNGEVRGLSAMLLSHGAGFVRNMQRRWSTSQITSVVPA